jgi:hypothetical protein
MNRNMPTTGAAYIAGFAPFPNKGIITGIGTAKKRYSKKSKDVPAAGPGPMMADCFIGNNKAVVFKAEPFTAFGAVDGITPVEEVGSEKNADKYHRAKSYIAHIANTSNRGNPPGISARVSKHQPG